MSIQDFSYKLQTQIEHLTMSEKDALRYSPEGQYYAKIVESLAPDIKRKIKGLFKEPGDLRELFKNHWEIVTFLQLQGYLLDPNEILKREKLWQTKGESEVELFIVGADETYNAGTYAGYFSDWQIKEFIKRLK